MNIDQKRKEELLDFEKEMGTIFLERHFKRIVDKNPKDIIQEYIEWRHSRYIAFESDDVFFVVDMCDPLLPVATFLKEKDPDAFNHAWTIAEMLNNLPTNICSIGGRAFEYEDIDLNFSNANDFSEYFTIDNVIKNNIDKHDEED